ncbi:hypothetical protein MKY89_27910 [Bacillus sp. FSL W7-1294]|uniref:hypothetical protein n=1 Tax=Bacillus TaxID=1386 RepID=UPI00077A8DB8|nr:hypothetical protein [Bacillus cereus]KXY70699.1 hypothetical protein AT270_27265 [Bacillus cereus]
MEIEIERNGLIRIKTKISIGNNCINKISNKNKILEVVMDNWKQLYETVIKKGMILPSILALY